MRVRSEVLKVNGFKALKKLTSKQAEKYVLEQAENMVKYGLYEPAVNKRVRAKFPNEVLWTGERKAKLTKAVAQFNSTIARLDKRYAGMVQLPNRVDINAEIAHIRSAKELNARVHQLEMILKKNSKTAQQIVTRYNSETGEVVYRLRYLDRELKSAKKKLDARYEHVLGNDFDREQADRWRDKNYRWVAENFPEYADDGDALQRRIKEVQEQEEQRERDRQVQELIDEYGIPREEIDAREKAREYVRGWNDVSTDDMDADDLDDLHEQLSEKASDYADLYLDTWDAYAGDYDGHDVVAQIIEEFKRKNPKALEDIFTRGPNGTIPPEAMIEYMYHSAGGGGVSGGGSRSGKSFHKESFTRDTEAHARRLFNIERFWEDMAAEYGLR